MYDLNHLNDPREFDNLIHQHKLYVDANQIRLFKKHLFLASLCAYTEENDDFNLWRLYGNNGKGVAIIFELENNDFEWFNFLIGKVVYDKNHESSLKINKAISIINDFISQGLKLERLPAIIGQLLLLHKNSIWSIEEEYRLLTFLEYDEYTFKPTSFSNPLLEDTLRPFLNSNGDQIAYLEFPLKQKINQWKELHKGNEEWDEMLKTIPVLRIKKIIAGYNISEELFSKLLVFVHILSTELIGYYITVTRSKYQDFFK